MLKTKFYNSIIHQSIDVMMIISYDVHFILNDKFHQLAWRKYA